MGTSLETIETGLHVVCDAGPVIHLDELGCLDLLHDFPHVIVPAAVRGEIVRHTPGLISGPVISRRRQPDVLKGRTALTDAFADPLP